MFEAGCADCSRKDEAGVLRKSLSTLNNYALLFCIYTSDITVMVVVTSRCRFAKTKLMKKRRLHSTRHFFLSSFVMSRRSRPNFLHNSLLVSNIDLMYSDTLSAVHFSQFSSDRNVSLALWQIETHTFAAAHNACGLPRSFPWLLQT